MTAEPSVALRFADAFHTRDPGRVAEVFTPDARYVDLFYGDHRGRAAIRDLFARMYADGHDHRWAMGTVVADGSTTIAEWRFTFTVSGSVARGGGRTLCFDGVSVFATRDGRCSGYREYFDRGAALLAVGVPPAAVARIAAHRPTVAVTAPGAEDPGPWTTAGS
jgi:ketosteroid isomerase-like protein